MHSILLPSYTEARDVDQTTLGVTLNQPINAIVEGVITLVLKG
jgi:hypothetical protein